MFCTVCAAANGPSAPACAACGAALASPGAIAPTATAKPRGAWRTILVRLLYAAPLLALVALGAFAVARDRAHQRTLAAAYARGEQLAAAGDPLRAQAAFGQALGFADAADRQRAMTAELAPHRAAYLDGLAALDDGDYDRAIAELAPVARAVPGLEDVTNRLADARRLRVDDLWRAEAAAEARRDWTGAEAVLRDLAALDPADRNVAARAAQLTREHGPIAFSHNQVLVLAEPDGSDPVPILPATEAMWPTWSPDRAMLAYLTLDLQSSVGDVNLMVVGADGTGARRLATDVSSHAAPVWSPDGRFLAFTSFFDYDPILDDGPIAVHTVEVASGREIDVSGDRFALAFNPAWRPDGQAVAFVAKQRGLNERPQQAPGDLYLSVPGSGRFENLTDGAVSDIWSAAWRPGGSDLLIYSLFGQSWYDPPETAISLMSLPDGKLRRIDRGDDPAGAPVWSPDGRRFAYTRGERDIVIVEDETRRAFRAPQPISGDLTWSPDGMMLLAAAVGGGRSSALIDVDAGPDAVRAVALEYDADPPFLGPPQWAPSGPAMAPPDPSLDGTALDNAA